MSQKVKGVLNVKFSLYYFHIKTKLLADFYTGISVPLNSSDVISSQVLGQEKLGARWCQTPTVHLE